MFFYILLYILYLYMTCDILEHVWKTNHGCFQTCNLDFFQTLLWGDVCENINVQSSWAEH